MSDKNTFKPGQIIVTKFSGTLYKVVDVTYFNWRMKVQNIEKGNILPSAYDCFIENNFFFRQATDQEIKEIRIKSLL